MRRRFPRLIIALGLTAVSAATSACIISHDDLFTEGRLQTLCGEAIPVCSTHASCALDRRSFYEGSFPGGQRFIVHTEEDRATVIVRFLLDDTLYPGSEMQVKVFTPNCGDFSDAHVQDVDLFERAGSDGILEYELETKGRGDHLLEVFSDMTARYLVTVEVEE